MNVNENIKKYNDTRSIKEPAKAPPAPTHADDAFMKAQDLFQAKQNQTKITIVAKSADTSVKNVIEDKNLKRTHKSKRKSKKTYEERE